MTDALDADTAYVVITGPEGAVRDELDRLRGLGRSHAWTSCCLAVTHSLQGNEPVHERVERFDGPLVLRALAALEGVIRGKQDWVTVEVFPPGPPHPDAEVITEAIHLDSAGLGVVGRSRRTEIRATHAPTGIVADVNIAEDVEDAQRRARGLLAARVAHARRPIAPRAGSPTSCAGAFELRALELVLGWPRAATVHAGAYATLRIDHAEGSAGVSLETGDAIPAPPVVDVAPPPRLVMTYIERRSATGWVIDGRLRRLARRLENVILADDQRVIGASQNALHLLDRERDEWRSLPLPRPAALDDPVTGGVAGYLNEHPLWAPPGFVVIARSPALLAIELPDLEAALRADRVAWIIETHLPLREPDRIAPARRGHAPYTVVTEHGALTAPATSEPVRVRDRLWPGNGWALVELADGSCVPGLRVPPGRRAVECEVTAGRLFAGPVTWPAAPLLPPAPSPPVGLTGGRPPRNATEAIALAHTLQLDERHLRGRPAANVAAHLQALAGSVVAAGDPLLSILELAADPSRGRIVHGACALLLLPLIGIAADPRTPERARLATVLAWFATMASDDPGATAERDGFRLALPVLLTLRHAGPHLLRAWAVLVEAVACGDGGAPWLDAAIAAGFDCLSRRPREALVHELQFLLQAYDLTSLIDPATWHMQLEGSPP